MFWLAIMSLYFTINYHHVLGIECTCHVNGTQGLCDNIQGVGVCTCKPGTTSTERGCDQCLPGYWGLHLGACRPCECCTNGSENGSCDQVTNYLVKI